jgi:hypothetical protein
VRHSSAALILSTVIAVSAFCQDKYKVDPWPSARGTINVVAANDHGIVVLTDSMLTETRRSANGVLDTQQLASPGQKLFRIDAQTVCAFAGFASADTPPVPDFLNSVTAIMGRFQDSLRRVQGLLTVSDKMRMLEGVFTYYLTGIANIRDQRGGEEDYAFELLLAGYDPDGTPEIGRLVLGTVSISEPGRVGPLLKSVTKERSVFPITHRQAICMNGITNVAAETLQRSNAWRVDPEVAACQQTADGQALLSIDQMTALAVSLKQKTADRYKGGGRPQSDRGSRQW